MRRASAVLVVFLAALFAGCSRTDSSVPAEKPAMCYAVKEALYRICKLERMSPSDHGVKVLDVRGMSARDFRRALESFPGKEVHLWMPGGQDWLLVANHSTNRVSLARAMDDFAMDTNCVVSIPEVFASYVGTREEVLPAFDVVLKGDVLPEWFVTKDIPKIDWLDTSGVDSDILSATLSEIRSMQVMRREYLRGNILAAAAKDKQGEEEAVAAWARVALRNPHDPMLLERLERLNRNAKGFLEVGKVLQAMKCYETIVLITPNDATAVFNFGQCLKKIGKLDLAEKTFARARLLREQ